MDDLFFHVIIRIVSGIDWGCVGRVVFMVVLMVGVIYGPLLNHHHDEEQYEEHLLRQIAMRNLRLLSFVSAQLLVDKIIGFIGMLFL